MAIVLPRSPSFGQLLGTGLGQGLEALAGNKLQQVQQRNLSKALEQTLPQENKGLASALSQLTPELQQITLKELLSAPGKQAYAQALGLGGEGKSSANLGGLTEKQAGQIAKLQQQDRQFNAKEQIQADKETLPYFNEVTKEAHTARNNDKRLARMEQLIKGGKLASPTTAALIDTAAKGIFGIGVDLSGIQSADTQEFNKLSKDFLKEAKSIFGSRLTDADLKAFLQTVPTLLQSDEGKIRVINNLKSFNDAAKIRKAVTDDIIESNNGRRPRNLESLVEKQAGPQLEIIAEQFKVGTPNKTKDVQKESEERNSLLGRISGGLKALGL